MMHDARGCIVLIAPHRHAHDWHARDEATHDSAMAAVGDEQRGLGEDLRARRAAR